MNREIKDEGLQSTPAFAKLPVSRRFLFQYRSWGKELMVTLEGKSLNSVLLKFAKSYHDIDEVYEIAEVDHCL